jgi:hypothetical protein
MEKSRNHLKNNTAAPPEISLNARFPPPPTAEVVQFYFTLPLGGSARFGPGRVTRWFRCSTLPSLRSTLPGGG